jgi:hypothetical protein
MKIFTKIVFDWDGNIVEQESFDYDGPVLQCKGGDSGPPPPTLAEEELTGAQRELIDQQVRQLTDQNDMIEALWPVYSRVLAGEADLSLLNIETAKQLQPLQAELMAQGIDLQSLQIETLKGEIARNKQLEPLILQTVGFERVATGEYRPTTPVQQQITQPSRGLVGGQPLDSPVAPPRTQPTGLMAPTAQPSPTAEPKHDVKWGWYKPKRVSQPFGGETISGYTWAGSGDKSKIPGGEGAIWAPYTGRVRGDRSRGWQPEYESWVPEEYQKQMAGTPVSGAITRHPFYSANELQALSSQVQSGALPAGPPPEPPPERIGGIGGPGAAPTTAPTTAPTAPVSGAGLMTGTGQPEPEMVPEYEYRYKESSSPALEASLEKEEATLRETLSRNLGPDYETSTPGIQAMDTFRKRADLLREESRRSMRGLAAGTLLSLTGRTAAPNINIGTGVMGGNGTGRTGISNILGGAGTGNVMSNITNLSEKLKAERMEPWLYKQGQGAGRSQAMMGGLMGGAQIGTTISPGYGTAIGAGVGLLAGYLLS